MKRVELKPIRDLLVDQNEGSKIFWIPNYQRGYRWTKQQVKQLLDDIREFIESDPDKGEFYCLQPIVVRKAEEIDYDFEIVDGQQRLTTIRILMTCLKTQLKATAPGKEPFTITFQTREETTNYLNDIKQEGSEESIDNHYIYEAFETINDWFTQEESMHLPLPFMQHLTYPDPEHGKDPTKLNINVKVIWCELAESDKSVDVFARLNVGKIPLTNDELIRALFLRQNAKYPDSNHRDHRAEIALEWDRIECDLQDNSFWYFLHDNSPRLDNRICFLFELFVQQEQNLNSDRAPNSDRDTYWLFYKFDSMLKKKEAGLLEQWKGIRQVFMTLKEWYADLRLYHMIGFLTHQKIPLYDILLLSKDTRKSEFYEKIVSKIFNVVFGKDLSEFDDINSLKDELNTEIDNLKYTDSKKDKIRSVLLLFNLVTLINIENSSVRFPFDKFKLEKWDIEHVRSTAELNLKASERNEWLKNCKDFLEVRGGNEDKRVKIERQIDEFIKKSENNISVENEDFERLYEDIREFFDESYGSEDSDDSIGNLVLLDFARNRGYKNAVFIDKRTWILSPDKGGNFVPPCTRNVFLKCYSKEQQHLLFWSENDMRDYVDAVLRELHNFFSTDKNQLENLNATVN